MNMLGDDTILLRAPEPADVDGMYLMENDPEIWTDGVTFAPLSRKQLWDYVESYDGNIFATGQLRMVIRMAVDNTMAGMVDLYDYDRVNRRAYVGITVAKTMRGQGIATRALTILCDYCRAQLGMHQLAAIVRVDNEASRKAFSKCGFKECGVMKSWVRKGQDWTDALQMQCILE